MRLRIPKKICLKAPVRNGPSRKTTGGTDVILVAVGLGAGSRAALRFAGELARAQGCKLRIVHATPERWPVAPLRPPSAPSVTSRNRETWLCSLHEALQNWARSEAGEVVAPENIRVEFCTPVDLILREAGRSDVKLVLLGGLPNDAAPEHAKLPQDLLRRCPRPMLFVGPQGPRPIIVAATDCSDPTLPILSEAWSLAAALGDQVCLVHNVDPLASQFGERIGMTIDPSLADLVAQRSKHWLETRAAAGEVIITRDRDNARGILAVAGSLQADVLVVGVKQGGRAPHGTADRILRETRRSVLFVPLKEQAMESAQQAEALAERPGLAQCYAPLRAVVSAPGSSPRSG